MRQLWNELLQLKELTAITVLLFGMVLAVLGFYQPPVGEVSDSVLYILAQTFLFAGSVLGVSSHYATKQKELEQSINDRFNKFEKETKQFEE